MDLFWLWLYVDSIQWGHPGPPAWFEEAIALAKIIDGEQAMEMDYAGAQSWECDVWHASCNATPKSVFDKETQHPVVSAPYI